MRNPQKSVSMNTNFDSVSCALRSIEVEPSLRDLSLAAKAISSLNQLKDEMQKMQNENAALELMARHMASQLANIKAQLVTPVGEVDGFSFDEGVLHLQSLTSAPPRNPGALLGAVLYAVQVEESARPVPAEKV